MLPTVLMYSYKGGAGRTVSTANVASVLAKEHGKKVVCIDLDIESAGLSVVFNVHHKLADSGRRCLQDVLRQSEFNTEKFREWWPSLHFDIGETFGLPPGRLRFIASRTAHHDLVNLGSIHGGGPLDDLIQHLRLDLGKDRPDILILDSASGLGDQASLGLICADCVVEFFRWNSQFVEGAIEATRFILANNILKNVKKVIMVPTAVPDLEPNEEELINIRDTNLDSLKIEIGIEKNPRVELLDAIPESKWLKWRECILPFEKQIRKEDVGALEAYRAVATRLAAFGVVKTQ